VRTLIAALIATTLAGVAVLGAPPDELQDPRVPQEATAPQQPAASATEPTRPSFSEFLDGIRREARTRGIREDVIAAALASIDEPLPVVIERDRSQAEIVLPLEAYVERRLTAKLIATGRDELRQNRELLKEVTSRYGVAPDVLLAVWGIESNFGRFSGVRPTVAALATLAWDPRRSTFFRGELFDALEILNRGDIGVDSLRGSWAGAMGQTQFMPSSYLQFAEDFDGDGRRDIWASMPDVLASIANYLKAHGWSAGQSWGQEVKLSAAAARRITQTVARRDGTCMATRDMTIAQPAQAWQQLGVRTIKGKSLPKNLPESALVSGAERHFLVSSNYDSLLAYNCAHSYAISVGLLADQISGKAPPPKQKLKKRTRHRRA